MSKQPDTTKPEDLPVGLTRIGEYIFNQAMLRSTREATDKSGYLCFYGNTTGQDALCRGKLPTKGRALAWVRGDASEVPA